MSHTTENTGTVALSSNAAASRAKKSSTSVSVLTSAVTTDIRHSKLSNSISESGVEDERSETKDLLEEEQGEHGDAEEMGVAEAEEEEEPELPYEPPPLNFIKVEFGDSSPILLNHDCKKKILVDYINSKLSTPVPLSVFDMCDTEGRLVGLRHADTHTNVRALFAAPEIYVPCHLLLNDQAELIEVEPCLNHWRAKYPAMEETISNTLNRFKDDDTASVVRSISLSKDSSSPNPKELPKATAKKGKK